MSGSRIGLVLVCLLAGPGSPVEAAALAQGDSTARARALHALSRLTWGPRPGDVQRVASIGVDRFIEEQLHPESIPDDQVLARLARYDVLGMSPGELAATIRRQQQQRILQRRAMGRDSAPRGASPPPMDEAARRVLQADRARFRRLLAEVQTATLARAVHSQRQLYEVLVDFWTNHFNVFIGKGAVRPLVPAYIEESIRPHAMGRFEDLLIATARSPAMLLYLDNAQSVADGAEPPQPARLRRRAARRNALMADSMLARVRSRMPRGLNENYARELLELHTLGVDGGYSQQDVRDVARILTGWSVARPPQEPEFVFHAWAHDRADKTVLGRHFPAGGGEREGMELLHMLARHPSTMRHLSHKLCARLVNDTPPDGCVDAAVAAWQRTGGDIREVVRAIVTSPDFWAPENRAVKIKTPLEFVVSAVRAVNGELDTTLALPAVVARLGQPLFGQQPPTGYPETRDSWVNSGAMLERMNVAMGLAAGRLPGVVTDLGRIPAGPGTGENMIAAVNQALLNGAASPSTLRVMRNQMQGLDDAEARTLAVGLALGSPEFQRQ